MIGGVGGETMVGGVGERVVWTGREKGVVRSGRAVVEAQEGSKNRYNKDFFRQFLLAAKINTISCLEPDIYKHG